MSTESLMSTALRLSPSGQSTGQPHQHTDPTNDTRMPDDSVSTVTAVTSEYNTTQEPDAETSRDLVLQLSLPMIPLLLAGLCFLYRYLYVTTDLRLGQTRRRSADSSQTSSEAGGITSGLAATAAGVASASFAPGVFSGAGTETYSAAPELPEQTQFGCAATGETNFRSTYAKYWSAASFSNFDKTNTSSPSSAFPS